MKTATVLALLLTLLAAASVQAQSTPAMEGPVRREFFTALYAGDVDTVRKCLEQVPDLARKNDNALHAAVVAQKNAVELTRLMLASGAALEKPSGPDMTPLMDACSADHRSYEIVKMLVDAGADVNTAQRNGMDALYWAVRPSQFKEAPDALPIVKLLISKGVAVNRTYHDTGLTPLMMASDPASRSLKISEALIAAGADVNSVDKDGATVLMRACVPVAHTPWPSGIPYIGRMPAPKPENPLQLIKLLVSKGADLRARDKAGRTTIMYAGCNLDAIKFLASKGSTFTAKSNDGVGVLCHMLMHGSDSASECLAAVQFAVSKGANVKETRSDGATPLHLACAFGTVANDVVAYLISKGASVDARTALGATPLHYAAAAGNTPAAKLLIAKGADVEAQTKDGTTPIAICPLSAGDCIAYLQSKGAKPHQIVEKYRSPQEISMLDEQSLRTLADRGLDLNMRDKKGRTPLHYVSYSFAFSGMMGPMVSMAAASELGSAPSLNEADKAAALYQVATGVSVNQPRIPSLGAIDKLVAFYVSKGADINAKDNEGRTPLHYAAGSLFAALMSGDGPEPSGDGSMYAALAMLRTPVHKVANALIVSGADVKIKDNKNATPLHYAGEIGVIKAMLDKGADINAKDAQGKTPLHHWLSLGLWTGYYAYVEERREAISKEMEALPFEEQLRRNPDVELYNEYVLKVVDYAISKGADINAKDSDGNTPLACCGSIGEDQESLAKALKERGMKE